MSLTSDMVRSEDLFKILEISRSLVTSRNLDEILNLMINSCCDVLRADRASVFLVDEEHQELFIRVATGEKMKEIRFPIDKGIAGFVCVNSQTLNIPDVYQDERFNSDVDKKTGYKTRSMLTMPLDTGEKVVGVIQVINKEENGQDLAFDDYDEKVLAALAAQAAVTIHDYWMNAEMLNKKEMEAGLSIARDIQKSFLPTKPPEIEGLDIFAFSESCDETGGDYYDYHLLDDENIIVVIGDVTGHGVGSSLLMASARSALHALWLKEKDPQKLLETLNDLIEEDMGDDRFITIFLGVFDMKRHRLTYSSAGHDSPILYRPSAETYEELESTGIPLGMMAEMEFPNSQVYFKPGDKLYLMTDGVWEAMNKKDETYGQERLFDFVKKVPIQNAEDTCKELLQSVSDFCDGAAQRDDITLMVMGIEKIANQGLDILRLEELETFETVELDVAIPSTHEAKATLVEEIMAMMMEKSLIDELSSFVLQLCLDEALVNALEHGNDEVAEKLIKVVISSNEEYWSIVIEDEGEGFEDIMVPDPDDPASLELDHGRGLLIMMNFLDTLWYNKKGNAMQMIRRRSHV